MPQFDAIIVGAGVVGLAVARAIAMRDRSVLLIERAERVGTETSSRNSEVIHAGIYYSPDSLKARFCIAGKRLLYEFCERHGVPHRRCGKLIVAADASQVARLERLRASARRCGMEDLALLDKREAQSWEPALQCAAALHSPSSGIIDSHALMMTLLGMAEAKGAVLACHSAVTAIARHGESWRISVAGEAQPVVSARTIVNAAGLGADAVARSIADFPEVHVPTLRYAKGSYFSYAGPAPFRRLVYPLPEPGGLGTHLTLDLADRARFGPDVEWVDRIDYAVDAGRRDAFAGAIRAFWPGVDVTRLQPDYAGIRPKLSGPGDAAADFVVSSERDHGVPGIVNLFGIESPGLTASLALADHVCDLALAA